MSLGTACNKLSHALIAASDLQWLLSTDLQLPLPHSQEQQRWPAVQPVQQRAPAAPCWATWQSAPALCACCSAAGGVRSAEACQPCACREQSIKNANTRTSKHNQTLFIHT